MKKKNRTWLDKILTVVLLVALISCVAATVYIIMIPKQGERFTEFYILGPSGKACGYPKNLKVGESASVIIGVANHEGKIMNYTLEVWLVNETIESNKTKINHMYLLSYFNITLNSTAISSNGNWTPQWEKRYTFHINKRGKFKLWFLLFKNGTSPPPKFKDYAGTPVEHKILKILNEIGGKHVLSLNLNIVVR